MFRRVVAITDEYPRPLTLHFRHRLDWIAHQGIGASKVLVAQQPTRGLGRRSRLARHNGYIYYAFWKQLSSRRDEPNGVVIERFRAEPVSGFKGDAALSVLPIQADALRMAAAFCPVRLPGFGRRKYSEASKISKTGLWQGSTEQKPDC